MPELGSREIWDCLLQRGEDSEEKMRDSWKEAGGLGSAVGQVWVQLSEKQTKTKPK